MRRSLRAAGSKSSIAARNLSSTASLPKDGFVMRASSSMVPSLGKTDSPRRLLEDLAGKCDRNAPEPAHRRIPACSILSMERLESNVCSNP